MTDLKLVGKYLILALPCAVAGSYVAGITDVAVLRKLFGIFVLYIGINQLYVSFTNKPCKKRSDSKMICTPKVRHIWRCIFLWAKQEEKTKRTRQNSKSML
ncbi:MAG: sulfite exporter TauE/SafE family protein [[Eubacterium] siraeum]